MSNKPKLILKNVDISLSESYIEDTLQIFTKEKVSAKRFHYGDTGKRLPVVRLTCNSETAYNLLLATKYTIKGNIVVIERFQNIHRREINCYSCNEKGHIARSCPQLIAPIQQ